MRIDPFVIAIALSIVASYFFPQLGASDSVVPIDIISSLGISLIFFFYGLKLSTEAIRSGIRNWKLHVVVQGTTFIIFPLLVLAFYPLVKDTSHEVLWLSMLFLAALPSTVSSSVVMVALAKGNITAAIFNASISGIIGILITPLWLTSFIQEVDIATDFSQIYIQLGTEILLPLIIGLMTGLVIVLFFVVYGITGLISKRLHFNREDRITAQFCGSKKSLVHGTVFSKALFGQSSMLGLILLPLMLFHAFQILIISVLATRMGKEKNQ